MIFTTATILFWDISLPRKQRYGSTYINITLDEPDPADRSAGPEHQTAPFENPDAEEADENVLGEIESRSELYSAVNEKQSGKVKSYKVQSKIGVEQKKTIGKRTPAGVIPDTSGKFADESGTVDVSHERSPVETSTQGEETMAGADEGAPTAKKKNKSKKTFADTEAGGEAPLSLDTDREGDVPITHLIDTPAVMIKQGDLEFPDAYKNQEISTVSTIDIYLDNEGRVKNLLIARSGGREFDQAAIRMILSSKFSPAFAGTIAVPCIVRLEVVFDSAPEELPVQ